jgi:hypothetical protein
MNPAGFRLLHKLVVEAAKKAGLARSAWLRDNAIQKSLKH